MQLNINTDAAVAFTNKLEQMHKSALPSAIRGTLNKSVFDVKKNTMPDTASAAFEHRQPNFFKANSKFENAKGFNVNTMKAIVGFVETGLKGGNNHAVKDLEQQEDGGSIGHRSFVPLKAARIGNSMGKNVRANARLSSIKKIVDVRKMASAKSKKAIFAKAVLEAGRGGYVLSGKILWKINTLNTNGGLKYTKTAMYAFKQGRSVSVRATGFMKKASLDSAGKMEGFFAAEAQRQFDKLK